MEQLHAFFLPAPVDRPTQSVCRLRRRRHWSSWGEPWCHMPGRSPSLTDHSDHRSEYNKNTTKLPLPSGPASWTWSHRLAISVPQINEAGDETKISAAPGGWARGDEEARSHQMITIILPSRSLRRCLSCTTLIYCVPCLERSRSFAILLSVCLVSYYSFFCWPFVEQVLITAIFVSPTQLTRCV